MTKRVLIITYYWPPQGGSGVQRWLKFAKYLRDFGWEPVVYTPENPEMMATDHSLLSEIPANTEVIKRKITEPYSIYKLFTGKRETGVKPGFISDGKKSLKEKLSLFLRSNLFIPDPKVLWISPSARFLINYIAQNSIDAIVSTGPPHSMHLIARRVARKCSIPWVADFRDPWTRMYNFKYMGHTLFSRYIHSTMEKKVIRDASALVTVTNTIAAELREIGGGRDVHVITNGYDPQDFEGNDVAPEERFTITYTGLFVDTQNPVLLWKWLGERCKTDIAFSKDLRIRIIGHTDTSILNDVYSNGLENNLVKMDYTPHDQVVRWQRKARVLLLAGGREPESKGILTGKFFEYLAAKRPILGFGPKGGDMDIALEESCSGKMFDYTDITGPANWIEQQYRIYKEGGEPLCTGDNTKYSRRELTSRMAHILDSLLFNIK
ncbi:MAG: glycosyltransferase family 4 protein [Rikenellaceae bacterium]|nr:glycosyltransferase family 4 protein [Rikenellaceae bacterium]